MARIAVVRDGPLAVITLADPAGRNVLSDAMLEELAHALAAAQADAGVRAIILAAEGPVFSAGHDLRALKALSATSGSHEPPDEGPDEEPDGRALRLFARCAAVMRMLAEGPLATIAAVEGVATAAGCQLVASCDLALAGADARFATPGVAIGLFCSTPAVALTRTAGRKAAMEMLLTGEMIDAHAAAAIGLVNRVTAPGQALSQAMELGRRVAAGSADAIARGKRLMAAQACLDLAAAYEVAGRAMALDLMTPDATEGIDAFLARRPARFAPRAPGAG